MRRGSLLSAINWMGGLALLLFWLPVFGPLVAGLVGGVRAGGVRRALAAVFVPGIMLGLLTAAAVAYLTDYALWGAVAGLGAVAWAFAGVGPMLVGAVVGGAFARARDAPRDAPAEGRDGPGATLPPPPGSGRARRVGGD